MVNFYRYAFLILTSVFAFHNVSAQLITPPGSVPQTLVQNVLLGNGLTATGVVFQGNPNAQLRRFTALGTNLGIDSGLVLSTASITANNSLGGLASGFTTPAGTGGYSLLNGFTNCGVTNNAAVLTFNFVPQGDTLKFRYVFASEEYNEFVNSSYNDVFAFYLTGPNPAGGNYNNTNIAIIPGTANTPVSINNVNNGYYPGCTPYPAIGVASSNPIYYRDNCNGNSVIFDGFTVPLTAIANVVPCSTYTIRLAVADACDGSLNSAVFLEANSFQSTGFQLSVGQNSVNGQDTVLSEGCGFAKLVVTRTNNFNATIAVPVMIGGTATNGTDYQNIPDTLYFLPGQISDTIMIQPIFDLAPEPDETITITVNSTISCSNSSSSITFTLKNYEPLAVDAGNDTVMTCLGGTLTSQITGGVPTYDIDWDFGAASTPTYTITPIAAAWHYVTVTDTCGVSATDSVFVDYFAPEFAGFSFNGTTGPDAIEGCATTDVTIYRTENLMLAKTYNIQVTGAATNGTDYVTVPATISFPAGNNTAIITIDPAYDMATEPDEDVIISIVDTLCDGTLIPLSQTVMIRNLDPVNVETGPDILIDCPRMAKDIVPYYVNGWQPLAYAWNNGAVTPDLNVFPADTTLYIVTVTDSCGYSAEDSIYVNVAHDPVADFSFPDGIYCAPGTVQFTNASLPVSGPGLTYSWNFEDGYTDAGASPQHTFTNAGEYDVELIVTNDYNCQDTLTLPVWIRPVPDAIPMFTPQNPSTLNPEVTFTDKSIPDSIVQWYWETGDGGTYTAPTFVHPYDGPGEYNAYLHVTSSNGCTDSILFNVIVVEETSVYIPNSFTPNDDGLNDEFTVIGTNWRSIEFRIFNRWGEEIFYTDKPGKGWNGRVNNEGDVVMAGAYVYKVFIIDLYGKEYSYSGHINIMR